MDCKNCKSIPIKIFNATGRFDHLPEYHSDGAAGMDLKCFCQIKNGWIVIGAGATRAISTGLYVEIPEGYEMQIRSRSGLAIDHGISVLNSPATIDSDYRGELKIILHNHGKEFFQVRDGMRIAQAVVVKIPYFHWEQVEDVKELSETKRSGDGIGSTGY